MLGMGCLLGRRATELYRKLSRVVKGRRVNGRLTEAPEGASWCLRDGAAAGRAAAEVRACAEFAAPPSRRGHLLAKTATGGSGGEQVACPVFGQMFPARIRKIFLDLY